MKKDMRKAESLVELAESFAESLVEIDNEI